jgi:N-acetylglucosaminyldiphosphoundecaprenol N-acetyl-beta-D-mannosaminyltransferase
MEELRNEVAAAEPDIVLVALGSPKQERLIEQLREVFPAICWMGVGISLSFVTGDVARAPLWMQRTGLEWFHRLVQEPRRLFARYVIHGVPWFFVLLLNAALQRFKILDANFVPHRP